MYQNWNLWMVCSYHVTSGIDRLLSCHRIGFGIVLVDVSISSAEVEAKMDQPCNDVWAEEGKSWQCSRNSEISQVISRGFCFSLFLTSLCVDVELVGLKAKKNACITTYDYIQVDFRLQSKLLTVRTSEVKKKNCRYLSCCLKILWVVTYKGLKQRKSSVVETKSGRSHLLKRLLTRAFHYKI